jgi:galactose mutarotase-like enzyme
MEFMTFLPNGGLWGGVGRRNRPVVLQQANPLPENKMSSDRGDAGLDGYTVKSRANRITGERPSIDGRPVYGGPRTEEN